MPLKYPEVFDPPQCKFFLFFLCFLFFLSFFLCFLFLHFSMMFSFAGGELEENLWQEDFDLGLLGWEDALSLESDTDGSQGGQALDLGLEVAQGDVWGSAPEEYLRSSDINLLEQQGAVRLLCEPALGWPVTSPQDIQTPVTKVVDNGTEEHQVEADYVHQPPNDRFAKWLCKLHGEGLVSELKNWGGPMEELVTKEVAEFLRKTDRSGGFLVYMDIKADFLFPGGTPDLTRDLLAIKSLSKKPLFLFFSSSPF